MTTGEDKSNNRLYSTRDEINLYKLNLERLVGETQKEYHERLLAVRSTQIELIAIYEREKEMDRYRTTDETFKELLEEGTKEQEDNAKKVLLALQKEVIPYLKNYSGMSSRKHVSEKLKDLKLIV